MLGAHRSTAIERARLGPPPLTTVARTLLDLAREADAAKRLELEASGHRVIPLTWRQVAETPAATAASLRRLLAAAQAT